MKRENDRTRQPVASATRRWRGIIIGRGLTVAVAVVLGPWTGVAEDSPQPSAKAPLVRGELINPPAMTNVTTVFKPPPLIQPTVPPGGLAGAASRSRISDSVIKTNGGYLEITFDRLASFPIYVIHQMVDPVRFTSVPKLSRPVPAFIKSLDNQKVTLTGFMLPLKLDNARVTEFLLMRNRSMCCYGRPLQINEVALVHMKGQGVKSIMDQPITVYGIFHVSEILESEQRDAIYRLDGEKMVGPFN